MTKEMSVNLDSLGVMFMFFKKNIFIFLYISLLGSCIKKLEPIPKDESQITQSQLLSAIKPSSQKKAPIKQTAYYKTGFGLLPISYEDNSKSSHVYADGFIIPKSKLVKSELQSSSGFGLTAQMNLPATADFSNFWSDVSDEGYLEIPYSFDGVSEEHKNIVTEAMLLWESNDGEATQIKFVDKKTTGPYVVTIKYASDKEHAGATIGRQKNPMIEFLKGDFSKELALHELGHVIGFLHEDQRPDRADYVQIRSGAIVDGTFDQARTKFIFGSFTSSQVWDLGDYDCRSIMHNKGFDYVFKNGGAGCTPFTEISEGDYKALEKYVGFVKENYATKQGLTLGQDANDFVMHETNKNQIYFTHQSSEQVKIIQVQVGLTTSETPFTFWAEDSSSHLYMPGLDAGGYQATFTPCTLFDFVALDTTGLDKSPLDDVFYCNEDNRVTRTFTASEIASVDDDEVLANYKSSLSLGWSIYSVVRSFVIAIEAFVCDEEKPFETTYQSYIEAELKSKGLYDKIETTNLSSAYNFLETLKNFKERNTDLNFGLVKKGGVGGWTSLKNALDFKYRMDIGAGRKLEIKAETADVRMGVGAKVSGWKRLKNKLQTPEGKARIKELADLGPIATQKMKKKKLVEKIGLAAGIAAGAAYLGFVIYIFTPQDYNEEALECIAYADTQEEFGSQLEDLLKLEAGTYELGEESEE